MRGGDEVIDLSVCAHGGWRSILSASVRVVWACMLAWKDRGSEEGGWVLAA